MGKIHYCLSDVSKALQETQSMRKGRKFLQRLHIFNMNSGKLRQKRSDGLANILSILAVIVPQIEMDTLRWGQFFPKHDGTVQFYTRGLDYLHQQTGMPRRTIVRAFRALRDAGYIHVDRQEGIGKDGKEIRFYSLRTFTKRFFRDLGISYRRLEKVQNDKRKKQLRKKGTSIMGRNIFSGFAKKAKQVKSAYQKTMTPKDSSSLLQKASYEAERTGRNPMDVYRELMSAI